ncbi:hypothetical protein R3W88_000792 [Solanum pinnatisectum]|uniref:Transmembrane protein n=1 Tax=Solanum pinnatisectum TaxID=50273 RepID=A0AAV9MGG8_9SOLN|nr:hypothetical protein R3W88_000792 [Solanum pinnatisectum]
MQNEKKKKKKVIEVLDGFENGCCLVASGSFGAAGSISLETRGESTVVFQWVVGLVRFVSSIGLSEPLVGVWGHFGRLFVVTALRWLVVWINGRRKRAIGLLLEKSGRAW